MLKNRFNTSYNLEPENKKQQQKKQALSSHFKQIFDFKNCKFGFSSNYKILF